MKRVCLVPCAFLGRPCARRLMLVLVTLLVTACAMPERAMAPQLYDFGPPNAQAPASPATALPPLALQVHAAGALESRAMLYRLAYADVRQLRAYTQSRWALPPADLMQQRLRDGLGRHYAIAPVSGGGANRSRVLVIELEEFSQVFSTPSASHALLRLRASVVHAGPDGERMLDQRVFHLQHPAQTADAPGGVIALNAASERAVDDLLQWLAALR